ncbi:MAG: T9SS type A sorting domain-containing protein [Bacteroidales bacterium]
MKTFILIIMSCFLWLSAFSQPYGISNTTEDYYDTIRERWIETAVYYPSVIDDGTTETFPFIVFGHGFSINYSKYEYMCEHVVPQGYIMILPNTETGVLGVDHGDFGNDLGYLAGYFYQNSLDPGSMFHNNVEPYPAVMGHSMGGGAAHLASEAYTDNISTVISFAEAETDPSSEAAAANADLPVYVFYAENDAVSPPDENQIPLYNNSNSSCKTLINVLGGGHCFFAESDMACDMADGSATTITREEQHDITLDFLDMILDFELKGNQNALLTLKDSLELSPRIDFERDCPVNIVSIATLSDIEVDQYTPFASTGVPGSVGVTLEDTDTEMLDINWDSSNYNGDVPGTYTITGDLVLIENVLNPDNLTANIDIIVNELTGISDTKKNKVKMYPNPADESISIKGNKITCVQLYDVTGTMIKQKNTDITDQVLLHVSSLPEGLYLIRIITTVKAHTYKLQIRH